MEIHVRNRLHVRVSERIGDDADGSFLKACREAPEDSHLHGVQSVGDTMFNELQAAHLVAELGGLAEEKQTDVIRRVAKMAQEAAACRGYLYISGD
ncbi:hypothetical protein ACFOOM_04995 [Streptomyces echinoruber]|uniref:Uncharacterized protein n=1 Tax=Streptomyces echinoruber TaxID=68898 RepID=A0A918VDW4_9ACTN|nr:hypothetical protein [Streptomyces echinoruber]GGZ90864.1 hypothetical protein GCM10010389_31650 [Streptomyces echinoruber]